MAAVEHRALYACRHCQIVLYLNTASLNKPACPRCSKKDYERVSVPAYEHASRAVHYMLAARPEREDSSLPAGLVAERN